MNVGVYFDLRNPPDHPVEWSRLYSSTLELCEEAEHLGAHSVWFSEHHLFDDGYLTQPLTFAAAVAARTKNVRIGTAVLIAPLRDTVHIAEEATVVDIVSGGRLDLGLGAGYRVPEYELFGADLNTRYGETDGRVRAIRAYWDRQDVLPPPVQRPVPIWLGYGGPQGARRAGVLGEGLLAANPALLEPYREGLVAGGHDPASARMAGVLNVWTTDDPERDWPLVSRHHADQWNSYRRHLVEGTGQPVPAPLDPERSRRNGLKPGFGNLLFGTPDEVATAIRGFVGDAPIETVFFWASLAGMDIETVAAHIRRICTEVAPRLA